MLPMRLSFLDFSASESITQAVERRIEKLEKHFENIISCEVSVGCPHRHNHAARIYQIQIHLEVPGDRIVVDRSHSDTHRNVYVAVRDAFDAAERQLQDYFQILRHEIKTHAARGSRRDVVSARAQERPYLFVYR